VSDASLAPRGITHDTHNRATAETAALGPKARRNEECDNSTYCSQRQVLFFMRARAKTNVLTLSQFYRPDRLVAHVFSAGRSSSGELEPTIFYVVTAAELNDAMAQWDSSSSELQTNTVARVQAPIFVWTFRVFVHDNVPNARGLATLV
jgi:hypothetical protein